MSLVFVTSSRWQVRSFVSRTGTRHEAPVKPGRLCRPDRFEPEKLSQPTAGPCDPECVQSSPVIYSVLSSSVLALLGAESRARAKGSHAGQCSCCGATAVAARSPLVGCGGSGLGRSPPPVHVLSPFGLVWRCLSVSPLNSQLASHRKPTKTPPCSRH